MGAGGCETRELAAVGSLAVPSQDDLVIRRDHVVDGHPEVWERLAVHGHDALESIGTAQVAHLGGKGWIVVESVWGDELVDQRIVAIVEALLEKLDMLIHLRCVAEGSLRSASRAGQPPGLGKPDVGATERAGPARLTLTGDMPRGRRGPVRFSDR